MQRVKTLGMFFDCLLGLGVQSPSVAKTNLEVVTTVLSSL